jgi:hypothetical protein
MAAAYLFHIVSNHPFVDGNKRAGLLAAQVFLDLNGVTISSHDSEAFYDADDGRRRGAHRQELPSPRSSSASRSPSRSRSHSTAAPARSVPALVPSLRLLHEMPELPLVPVPLATISSRPWTPNPTALKSAKTTRAGCAVRYTRGSRSGSRATTPPSRPARSSGRCAPSSFATRPGNSGTRSPNASTTRARAGATLERPGLAKLLQRIEVGDVHRVIVYRVDRLTRKLADLSRLAAFFERHRVGLTIVAGNIDADAARSRGCK